MQSYVSSYWLVLIWHFPEWTLTILIEDGRGVKVVQNVAVLLKWALHLLPGHEFTHLPRQLHEFLRTKATRQKCSIGNDAQTMNQRGGEQLPHLEVDMPVGKAVGTPFIEEVDVFDEQAEEWDDYLEGRREERTMTHCYARHIVKITPGAFLAQDGHLWLAVAAGMPPPTFSLLLWAVCDRCAAPFKAVL